MAVRAPNTRNWKAWEDRQPGPEKIIKLIVTGEVEVSRTNDTPELKVAAPQGINPKILLLNLSINSPGAPGGEQMTWKEVRFEKAVSAGEYTNVSILWEGNEIANCKVKVVS
jgi:hypothetical protein